MKTAKDFSIILWGAIRKAEGSEVKLKAVLAAMEKPVLVAFYKEFLRARSNLWKEAEAGGWVPRRASEDMLKDLFSHVVSRGREFYDEVLAIPKQMPKNVGPGDSEFYGLPGRVFWERFEEEITEQ